MSKRQGDQLKLSDVLKEFVDSNNLQKGLDKIDAQEAWNHLMGKGVNSYTSEVILKGHVLYVKLTSSVLREELSYGKEKIVAMLNEHLNKEIITKVVFC